MELGDISSCPMMNPQTGFSETSFLLSNSKNQKSKRSFHLSELKKLHSLLQENVKAIVGRKVMLPSFPSSSNPADVHRYLSTLASIPEIKNSLVFQAFFQLPAFPPSKAPGPALSPLAFGGMYHSLNFTQGGKKYLQSMTNFYGQNFSSPLIFNDTTIFTKPESIRTLNNARETSEMNWPLPVKILLGKEAFTCQYGQKFSELKSILVKAVGQDALRSYAPAIDKCIRETLDSWTTSGELKGYQENRTLLLQIALQSFASVPFGSVPWLSKTFHTFISGFSSTSVSQFVEGLKARNIINNFLLERIKERRKSQERKFDVLQYLLDHKTSAGTFISDDVISSALINLLFASHDTTSSAITHVLFHLSKKPEVIKKGREEALRLLKNDRNSPVTYEAVKAAQYAEMIFNETLRLCPPVIMTFRKVREHSIIDGVYLKQGTTACANIVGVHSDPKLYENPEDFDPSRFHPENVRKMVKGQFCPFGGGFRMCLGSAFATFVVKMFLLRLFLSYDFELASDQDLSFTEDAFGSFPKDFLRITFSKLPDNKPTTLLGDSLQPSASFARGKSMM